MPYPKILKKNRKILLFDAFKKFNGNLKSCADHLGLTTQTLYTYIAEDEELEDALYESRRCFKIQRLDAAEFVLDYMMNQKSTFPRISFDTARYILETHGKKRGYTKSNEEEPTPSRDHIIELENQIMKLNAELQNQKKINKKNSADQENLNSETIE